MNYFSATSGTAYLPLAPPETRPCSVLVQGIGGLQWMWVGMDVGREEQAEAARLNANQAVDWNGLTRYHVMEMND